MSESKKLSAVAGAATRIRTPLGLAGLISVLLYATYRQVLSLPVFSMMDLEPTFLLLTFIVDRVFLIALIAILIAGVGYILPIVIPLQRRRSSNVVLLDASLDEADSNYKQTNDGGVTKVRPSRNSDDRTK